MSGNLCLEQGFSDIYTIQVGRAPVPRGHRTCPVPLRYFCTPKPRCEYLPTEWPSICSKVTKLSMIVPKCVIHRSKVKRAFSFYKSSSNQGFRLTQKILQLLETDWKFCTTSEKQIYLKFSRTPSFALALELSEFDLQLVLQKLDLFSIWQSQVIIDNLEINFYIQIDITMYSREQILNIVGLLIGI